MVRYSQTQPIQCTKQMNFFALEDLFRSAAIYAEAIYELNKVRLGERISSPFFFFWGTPQSF